jgi:ATP-dependent exoDNAse (exonuclease V) alpha subunit
VTEPDLELFESRVITEGEEPPEDYLVLTTRKNEARRLNRSRFDALPGPPQTYTAVSVGRFARELDDEELPAPRMLELKVGARVLLTVNDSGRRWVNGTLATVTKLEDESVTLRDEKGEFRIEPHIWKKVRYVLRAGLLAEEVTDKYSQFPLLLGWAVTIHRAQGRTLEKVFVDLSRGAFAAGQAYVAISRVTRLEGLLLRSRPYTRDFFIHDRVSAFLGYIEGEVS